MCSSTIQLVLFLFVHKTVCSISVCPQNGLFYFCLSTKQLVLFLHLSTKQLSSSSSWTMKFKDTNTILKKKTDINHFFVLFGLVSYACTLRMYTMQPPALTKIIENLKPTLISWWKPNTSFNLVCLSQAWFGHIYYVIIYLFLCLGNKQTTSCKPVKLCITLICCENGSYGMLCIYIQCTSR